MPSLTITYTTQEGQRVATALGRLRGLRDANGPRDATAAEVKTALINTMRGWVVQSERELAEQSISIAAFDPT